MGGWEDGKEEKKKRSRWRREDTDDIVLYVLLDCRNIYKSSVE